MEGESYVQNFKTDIENVTPDVLTVDEPIRGQEWVCLSFLSPESIIENKEAFKVSKFLQSYAKENNLELADFYNEYLNFCYKFQDNLDKDYSKNNNNVTSMRGIKVRGVFNTREEAEEHSQLLQKKDKSFHVFIGQVGFWLPWDPCPDNIENEHFQNEKLNELMFKYKENEKSKDIFYEERKQEMIDDAVKEKMEHDKKKLDDISENNLDPELEDEPEPEFEPEPEKEINDNSPVMVKNSDELECNRVGSDSNLDQNLVTNTFEENDPWVKKNIN